MLELFALRVKHFSKDIYTCVKNIYILDFAGILSVATFYYLIFYASQPKSCSVANIPGHIIIHALLLLIFHSGGKKNLEAQHDANAVYPIKIKSKHFLLTLLNFPLLPTF